jgi:DNA-nicking Smr family endonuclease
MAKAKRYKEDINMLLKNKKLEVFLRNNENHNILNMINKRQNFIDVHGLNYEESKIFIKKKIKDIKYNKDEGNLDPSKEFCLTIITGKGNHSVGHRPVLLPKLHNYFSNNGSKPLTDWNNGIIKVYI